MKEEEFAQILNRAFLYAGIVVGIIILPKIPAWYGRYSNTKSSWLRWCPFNNQIAWFFMEIWSPLLMVSCYLLQENLPNQYSIGFLGLWLFHYFFRAIVYPMQQDSKTSNLPWLPLLFGVAFNVTNGYLNGRYLFKFSNPDVDYPEGYWMSWQFILGLALFFAGFAINKQSDAILLALKNQPKKYGESKYKSPRGCLFEYVSCPNDFGEIVEWFGYALLTRNQYSLVFALWATLNLGPRAREHHKWYKKQFKNYPANRKALIPGLL
eukprot:TRINITY_DN20984_c0_g1_i1.p1 TRINITY_DN20984_c0_g1~~TRINITY_DN20984_c0_g1_i1.p1  ORF type:complete len:266 (-),score=21.59 TRINITY_DN20984_c0_g1_i1:11-808(-)